MTNLEFLFLDFPVPGRTSWKMKILDWWI